MHIMSDFLTQLSDYLPLSPLATHIGVTCLIAQVTFTLLFNPRADIVPRGPWTYLTAFSAHQVVAFPLMLILTYIGWRDWFFDPNKEGYDGGTPTDRVFGSADPNNVPLAVGSGAILLWDIPLGFLSPPLRDPIMWGHHIGMFLVASVMSGQFCKHGNGIGHYYAGYYFGVIELSSIFLAVVDLFHPKYKHYYKWLNTRHKNKKSRSLAKFLNNLNEMSRTLFALSFLALRGVYFPWVAFRHTVPDLMKAYENPPDGVPMWTGNFLIITLSLFACLQAYWGLLIGKQVFKVFSGSSGEKQKKKSKKGKKKD